MECEKCFEVGIFTDLLLLLMKLNIKVVWNEKMNFVI
jgi:hypothetical protein